MTIRARLIYDSEYEVCELTPRLTPDGPAPIAVFRGAKAAPERFPALLIPMDA